MNTDDRRNHSIPLSLDPSIPSRATVHWTSGPLTILLKLLVRLYQCTFGIVLPNSCRYQPTCSHYALAALTEHGAVRGTWLAVKRVFRCHPFARGGYDPVPTNAKCQTPNAKQARNRTSAFELRTPDLPRERRTTTG